MTKKAHHSGKLSRRFSDALEYSFSLHQNQFRKGSATPYVSHLLGVASLVLEDGGSEDEAIAALLHDAVEDQGGAKTRAVIAERFGEVVAGIVDGCTDSEEEPKPPWVIRKRTYLASLETAPLSVLRVSVADKLYNIRSIAYSRAKEGEEVWKRFRFGRDGQIWYYRTFLKLVKGRIQSPYLDEIEKILSGLEGNPI